MITDHRHVISTQQFFNRSVLDQLFKVTSEIKAAKFDGQCQGKILATLFYEPSTRTRFSFEAAMLRLGGEVISTEAAAHFSSVSKGESLEDTIRVVSAYCDAIVLRHPEVGAAERAAEVALVPVINAGDGLGEHPTQALLDAFTIFEAFGQIDGLKVALVGDLRHGRTVHSLVFLLGLFKDIKIQLVSPEQLRMPQDYQDFLKTKRIEFSETDNLANLDNDVDVLYVTRVQKERFDDAAEYERLKHFFVVDEAVAEQLKPKAIIMHPLPRVGELDPAVDANPRARYFEQAANGLFVRMALLDHILNFRVV